MDESHKELLKIHRETFTASIEVDRLFPVLESACVLDSDDISLVKSATSRASQVEKLLKILPEKPSYAFQSFCHALESTYPHLLTVMFLGSNHTVSTPGIVYITVICTLEYVVGQGFFYFMT